ncbi:MAG: hypothetical protein ACOC1P_04855 [Minisyncoccales bacterium]
MRYCITGDSLILTNKGIIPIKSISDKTEAKIKLKVSSIDNKKNNAVKFFNSGKHKIIEIETESGSQIKGSYNHPVLCWTTENKKPFVIWKTLEKLTKNDIIILSREDNLFANKNIDIKKFYPKLSKKAKQIILPKLMNKNLAFLLGALVAEGSFHQNKIIFNNSDSKFYNKIKSIIFEQFPDIGIYERKIKGNCYQLEI